jgi:hypothetical protein
MNQMIYLPNLYEDESKVQIRIISIVRDKWDEYEIVGFCSKNPLGISKKVLTSNLTDTLQYDIIHKTGNICVGGLILIKKTD